MVALSTQVKCVALCTEHQREKMYYSVCEITPGVVM